MTDNTIQEHLRNLMPDTFASKYIFESIPHLFAGSIDSYISWKSELGRQIDVDPRAIEIIGSARIGISLNPDKALKPFGARSDVDVAVVSFHHFELAWRHMRTMTTANRASLTRRQREALRDHTERLIYWGTIATDRLLEILPFARVWVVALSHMAGLDPTADRDINVRIYRDFESLRAYQLRSVVRAREKVEKAGGFI